MIPTPDELREEYRLRFSGIETYRQEVWKILCSDYFSRFIPPSAHVLDLGAGWGEFINHIVASKRYAMDLNSDTAGRLAPGIVHLQQDCSREWTIAPESIDIVFTSNLLEHMPDKPCVERVIAQTYRALKPGGLLICMGPNIRCVPGAYWDFWDHHVPLSEQSLTELLQLKGFRLHLCLGRFVPFSMSRGRTPPLALVRWYLRLPFLWRLFGRQFLVIGKKALGPVVDAEKG